MPSAENTAARWRELAAEAVAVAAGMTDPKARAIMLHIADGYERLARYAEKQNRENNQ